MKFYAILALVVFLVLFVIMQWILSLRPGRGWGLVMPVIFFLLLVVSLMMMANTLRLTAYTRRKEVALAKMIGATKAFIRGPFNVEGVILGLSGSLLAFLAEWTLYTLLAEKLSASSLSFLHIIPFSELTLPVLVSFAAVGLLVAIFGSRIAIQNYMRV